MKAARVPPIGPYGTHLIHRRSPASPRATSAPRRQAPCAPMAGRRHAAAVGARRRGRRSDDHQARRGGHVEEYSTGQPGGACARAGEG
eukprot:3210326-Prymnesium_polylepis.1